MFELRDYQSESIDSVYGWFRTRKGDPLLVLPTGAGKSIIQAGLIRRCLNDAPRMRIIMVSHVKELLEQNSAKVQAMLPEVDMKFCSASMGQKDFNAQVLVCGIQTAHKYATQIGYTDLVILDEAQLLPDKDESMYRKFLNGLLKMNPHMNLLGMTATPYRLSSGVLYGQDDSFFAGVCYEVKITTLIEQGHLCRVTGRRGITHVDLSSVHIRGGEYIDRELQAAFDIDSITQSIVTEVIAASKGCEGVLMFSSGIQHANHLADAIRHITGERVEVVSGKTNKVEREKIIQGYKDKEYRWLINYGVLTTGFDAPHIDLLVMCRATKSTGLYVQIIGRGMRPSPGKDKCMVLDYGGNIDRHGAVDMIDHKDMLKSGGGSGDGEAPIKECPECMALIHLSVMICPDCDYEFPEPEPNLERTASNAAIMSDESIEWFDVRDTTYNLHKKQGKSPSMRVDYWIGDLLKYSEWVCFEHRGFARRKAESWSLRRDNTPPGTVTEALAILWPSVSAVMVKTAGKFPEIIDVKFGEPAQKPLPPPFPEEEDVREYNPADYWDTEDIPF